MVIPDSPASPNVAIYRNASPPDAPVSSTVMLDEGQSVFVTATATDPDGDPVLIEFGADPALTVTAQPDGKSALVAADQGGSPTAEWRRWTTRSLSSRGTVSPRTCPTRGC